MSNVIQIGEALMTWEQLSRPRKDKNDEGKETIKYSIDLMIEPNAPYLQAMLQLEAETKNEKFGPNYSGPYRSPFKTDQTRDIENQIKNVDPHGESGWRKKHPHLVGKYGVNLKNNDPIIPNRIVAGKVVKINLAIEKQEFYAGCYVYAMIRAYAYGDPKGKMTPGVSFGLDDVCVVRKGEPMTSARIQDSAKNFGAIAQNPAYHAAANSNAQMFPAPGQTQQPMQAPVQQYTQPGQPLPATPLVTAPPQVLHDPQYLAWLAEQERQRQAALAAPALPSNF